MSRYHSYLNNALRIIRDYSPGSPLHLHLRHFFSLHKKIGSKDRKFISAICYAYFRSFALFHSKEPEVRHLTESLFMCNQEPDVLNQALCSEWMEQLSDPIAEKSRLLGYELSDLFLHSQWLSSEIDSRRYAESLLIQPLLFIRIRPGKQDSVIQKLREAGIAFRFVNQDVLAFQNGTPVEKWIELNRDAVIQDLSSSTVFDAWPESEIRTNGQTISVWDVCAASGGKSILLRDKLMREIKLTVTDVRKSMLGNLHQRLAEARIPIHRSMAHDITIDSGLPSSELFDVIICDVPCSGSGTWARTPEQHYSFDPNTLSDLTEKQFRIVQNARQHLSGSGVLAYITCSVFAAENEWVINRIREELKLKVAYQQYLNGIDRQADTLFVAYLTNA